MDLSICMFFVFFAFFDLLFVCFFFVFILLSRQKAPKKKAKKKQIEKAKKKQQKCKGTSPFFSHFFTLFDVLCFPIYFASCFFSVLKFCFLMFHVFSFFLLFFSSLKNIKTSGRGEHNHSHSYVLTRGYPIQKKMAKILKAPKFKSPQKKTAKFRRKLSTSVPSSRSLGIWVSPPGRQNGTNSHVDQVEKLNFGCFGSPAFIRILRKPGWWLSHPSEKY